jgi:hypothetical protein
MDWKDVGQAIGKWAPAIGAVLAPATGGASLAIGAAVGALTKVLGVPEDSKPEDIMKIITGDPEVRLKIIMAENAFAVAMGQQELEKLKAELADTQNARQRETEITRVTGKRDGNMILVGWVIILGYLGMMGFLMYHAAHGQPIKDDTGILFLLVGNLVTFVGMIMAYLYGTTKSSQAKTDIIARSQPIK